MDSQIAARRYQKEIETCFYQFGQKSLLPANEYITEGRRLGQLVFLKLQAELSKSKRFTVAQPRFAGSIGKKTNVILPDLDLVVVVNKCVPPFDQVLEEFEKILHENQDYLSIEEGSIQRKTRFSIQFQFTCGIEVDLLPAANLPSEEIHKLIAQNPKKYYQYGSSLVSTQLDFMSSHESSFVHIIIRLTKFWYKSLSFGVNYVSGGCTMMELIGIAAAEEELSNRFVHKESVLQAMKKVFEMICNLKSLKLAFRKLATGKWERVPQNELYSQSLIPDVIGTKEILKKKYFIIEPANPYNNILGGNSTVVIDKLILFAKVTKERFSKILKFDPNNLKSDQRIITDLFDPQPISLSNQFPSNCPKYFHVQCNPSRIFSSSSQFCNMTVRNSIPLQNKEAQWTIETIKWRLVALITSMAHINLNHSEIEANVHEQVGKNFNKILQGKSGDFMDVTISIPFKLNSNFFTMEVSFSWSTPKDMDQSLCTIV